MSLKSVILHEHQQALRAHLSHRIPRHRAPQVKGSKFHGIGANKALARAAASELALQSLVKRPEKVTNPDGTESVKDETPWAELASFALHKLFCDWKRGVVGAPLSLESAATDKVVAGTGSAPPFFDLHARVSVS